MKRLAKLRQFRTNLDPLKYLVNEHRQNLLSVEASFNDLYTPRYYRSDVVTTFTGTLSPAYELITGLSVQTQTVAGPVVIGICEDFGTSGIVSATNCSIKIIRKSQDGTSTDVAIKSFIGNASIQSAAFSYLDVVDQGQYTYEAYIVATSATITNLRLFAYQIK